MPCLARTLGIGLAAAVLAGACTNDDPGSASGDSTIPAPEASGQETQPTAPDSQRVDLEEPSFGDPTGVHNPLFPISDLRSAVLLGNEEGQPLRIETVVLAEPKVIEWNDQQVETLVSQFVSYLDGRIHEVALDWYAQADDGAVWYFGEDVFNYEDGVVADTDGTWIAGRDGPPGMIMPAHPRLGDAYRPENIPDLVFEEVVVSSVGLTVPGPRGPVDGAIIGRENHLLEGIYEDKTFAPGYGEFHSGVGSNLEALALAVPTDALPGPMPAPLETIATGATEIFKAADAGDWAAATTKLDTMNTAWATHRATGTVPPLLDIQMTTALDDLAGNRLLPAVNDHNPEGARESALDVALAGLDLQLQYRPPADIDRARFQVWAHRLQIDTTSAEPDVGHIAGDVATLTWIADRIAHTLDQDTADAIDNLLADLETAADQEDVTTATDLTTQLLDLLAPLAIS